MLAAAGVFVGLNNRQEDEYSYFVSQMTFIYINENNMEAPPSTPKRRRDKRERKRWEQKKSKQRAIVDGNISEIFHNRSSNPWLVHHKIKIAAAAASHRGTARQHNCILIKNAT